MASLTRHVPGSVRELWAVAWPLVIASASNMFMLIGDRAVLGHYSIDAFNANVGALPWVWTCYFPLYSIVFVANVLVGRFNGAGEFEKIGPTVWQMLWLSLALFIPVLPLAWFLSPHLLAGNLRELGVPYLRILLPSVPISLAAFGALAAFFTGRGKTQFVSIVSIVCNLCNILFDVILVFGWGPIPEMGIAGAAWGTVIAQIIALVLFAGFFFTRANGKIFRVGRCRFRKKLFLDCIRIGSPNACSALINFSLWSWILQVMAGYVSADNFAAYGVSQSFYHVLLFFTEGVSFGVGTIVSNAYGANDWGLIEKNRRSWQRIAIFFALAAITLTVLCPGPLIALLVRGATTEAFRTALHIMLALVCFSQILCSFEFNLRQTLTAFGDTLFTMVTGLICYGGFAIVLGYFALKMTHHGASFLAVETISQSIFVVIYVLRCRHFQRTHRVRQLANF